MPGTPKKRLRKLEELRVKTLTAWRAFKHLAPMICPEGVNDDYANDGRDAMNAAAACVAGAFALVDLALTRLAGELRRKADLPDEPLDLILDARDPRPEEDSGGGSNVVHLAEALDDRAKEIEDMVEQHFPWSERASQAIQGVHSATMCLSAATEDLWCRVRVQAGLPEYPQDETTQGGEIPGRTQTAFPRLIET